MRITNNMLVKDMLWNSNRNLSKMSKKQTELSTGQRIHRPSDDPVGITQVLKFKTDIREAEQYGENIRDALGWLEVSESALTDVKDILQRIRELTVQAANGSNTAADTSKVKTEIEELTKEIIVLGNSTIAGRYIFSGLETNKALFNDDGTYKIDMTTERSDNKYKIGYEVSVGEVMDLSVHPADVFGTIQLDSYMAGMVTPQNATTTAATKGVYTATVDMLHPYNEGDTLEFEINGVTYNVSEGRLFNTVAQPLDETRFIDVLGRAIGSDGSRLSDVADVSFLPGSQLVITAKEFGASPTIVNNSVTTGFSAESFTAGLDAVDASFTGNFNLSDSEIARYLNTTQVSVTLDGSTKTFDVNMNLLNTAKEFVAEIQDKLDELYGENMIKVEGEDGAPLSFKVLGTNDGLIHSFDFNGISQAGSYFSGVVERKTGESTLATKSSFSTSVDINHDFSGDTLDIEINGSSFNVDESGLVNTVFEPMSKSKLIEAYRSASNGTNTLEEVADIYFDQNDKLTIISKTYGSGITFNDTTVSTAFSAKTVKTGVDATSDTVSTAAVLFDADIAAVTDTNSLVLTVDGVKAKFDIDFSALNTVNDLVTAVQAEIDTTFGAGKVTVAGGDGLKLDFTVSGTNDGMTHKVEIDTIHAQESEMIHDLKTLQKAFETKDDRAIQVLLGKLDMHLDRVLVSAGEIGGKTNRIEFISNRIKENSLTYSNLLSKVQDVDMAEAIMMFKNLENVYRASLSVGSKVIQPSLVDFIK